MALTTSRRRFLQAAVAGAAILQCAGRHPVHRNKREPGRLSRLDEYVESARAQWRVPGLAIAVVQNGSLVLARGYGLRAIGVDARVEADTVFPIASCTKPFTAAAIATLVDTARLQWDDPIARHLPSLRFSDPALMSEITIRHALAHRTGLPAANMLWRSGAFGSDEILARLRWLPTVAAPGERFLYNNNMYLALGKVVEQVSGRKWNEFLHDELFEPLGMRSTLADSSGIRELNNLAAPHAANVGKVQRIQPHCPDAIAPAGAIHSNVLDMAQWIRMLLEGGQFEGRRVLSHQCIDAMHTVLPRTRAEAPRDAKVPRAPISNYGLGWFFNDHAGRKVVEHSGTQTGFVSWIALMPEERLGLVILANHHGTGLNSALRSWILDACLDQPERDWSEIVRTDYANGYRRLLREAKAQFDAKRQAAASPSLPLSDYAGAYESKLYGRVQVRSRGNELGIRFGTRFDGTLQHWQDEGFRATFSNPRLNDWLVTFTIEAGEVAGLHAKEAPWAPAWYDDADDLGEFLRE